MISNAHEAGCKQVLVHHPLRRRRLALAGFLWIVLGPGPMDFGGGTRVRIADSHGPNPTGVPAELANANLAAHRRNHAS
jgi:hypothetical protein